MDRQHNCKLWLAGILFVGISFGAACAPVGSEAWCRKMKEKPKGDWTANETHDYARHCLFR